MYMYMCTCTCTMYIQRNGWIDKGTQCIFKPNIPFLVDIYMYVYMYTCTIYIQRNGWIYMYTCI